ncbi:hypothetical protein [Aliiroseovarius crassostreae]|uniref:hypothetical protein n=1 Tax=Aliiroseovarius crassostreae TaxID=154981 RepID=UPI0021FD7F1B|nr:hypothetical protein [Aliiroseovarius crassostreae]UWQ04229.1 hypothetical protein K3X22_11140 [Aliiroseovarius crassostreae]
MGDTKQAHHDKLEIAQNKEIQKLGWLSSYTRQVLLSRHALRTFYIFTDQMMRFSDDPIWRNSHNTAADTLRLLRALLETLSGTNKTTLRISAPYEPINRPTMFFLGERRSGRMIAVSTERTNSLLGQTIGTSFSTNGLSTGSSASWIGQSGKEPAMGILALETAKVGKGVGLSNKILADQRCEELVHSRLWPLEQGRVWQASELFAPFNSEHKGAFKFWRDWYQGFLDGKPLDWELQRRVALIPDQDWEKGPEHIARKIEEIRKEFEAEKGKPAERHKELEPSSVEHLLAAPSITANQIDAAAQDIRDAECKYLNDTGANALPEEFQSFPSIAYSLTQISQSIRSHHTTSPVEEELRQQIGRLNARIIELETELDKLRNSGDPVFLNAFKEQAGKNLGDWKMYGAVIGAVWLISGDTVGMKARLENLGAARDAIFGTAHPAPVEPVETLPNSTDV